MYCTCAAADRQTALPVSPASPGMRNDVCPFEAHHLVIAHDGGMADITLADLQDALKLQVVVRVPTPCGAVLLMIVIKCLNLRQQPATLLHHRVAELHEARLPISGELVNLLNRLGVPDCFFWVVSRFHQLRCQLPSQACLMMSC